MSQAAPKRPHILFLISDEHRPDVLGCEGNPIVRTPYLDALAKRGTYFRNCYCTSPVCVPSRQSFHSGKLPSTINCRKFGDTFDSDILTFPEQLSRHGYQTVAFGKMHFEDQDQLHGWRQRPMGDIHQRIDDGYDEGITPTWVSGAEYRQQGMGFWGPAKEVRNARAVGEDQSKIGYETSLTDMACKYLCDYFGDIHYDRPHGDQPLAFCLSLANPHYPYQCTAELMQHYITRVKPFFETAPDNHPCHNQYSVTVGEDVTEREVLRATAAYYGQVEFIDSMYGKVLDTLRDLNALDNFIIMYWSDHGEMLGEHGLWEKKQFYDGAARVPLIIHDPRVKAPVPVVNEVTSLLDLFPTVCDMADTSMPDDLEGHSLMPLIRGEDTPWRDEAISELWGWYHNCDEKGCRMVRRGKYKFVTYANASYPDQLFDMEADPKECHNLASNPAYTDVLNEFSGHRCA